MSQSLSRRARDGRRAVVLSIAANICLSATKITAGVAGNSNALIADGVESVVDVIYSVLLWFALRYAEKPPDREHPYGHGKAESLAALAGAFLLIAAGLRVGYESVIEILSHGQRPEVPAWWTLLVLAVVIGIKEGLYRYLSAKGKTSASGAMEADALHHRSDAITSVAAFIGIAIALAGGPRFAAADDWAALFCCVIILVNGAGMLRKAMPEVMDERVSADVESRILELACAEEGVTSAEKCRVRKGGLGLLVDLHVRVDGSTSVREGHAIAHRVKARLIESSLNITDVTVHLEPEEG